ncbi:MAG TPA: type II toxin-antitoxin system HicB family antitoxin [Pirellulales bacterium]
MSAIESGLNVEFRGSEGTPVNARKWEKPPTTTYECKVLVCPEKCGGVSVYALSLPGIASQGDSEPEALDNIRDALTAAIEIYKADGLGAPWADAKIERTSDSYERWILVNA